LAGADVSVLPEEVALDDLSRVALEKSQDRSTYRKLELLQRYAAQKATTKPHRLVIRFLVSPVELLGNVDGQVVAVRLVKNTLYATEAGTLRPSPTDQFETLPAGLVFRSVGYRGVPLPGVPFDERWGVILNQKGRVLHPETLQPRVGEYTAGWIKRGPTGVIGTNKPDALETVRCMVEDLAQGAILSPAHPQATAAAKRIRERQPAYFSYADWRRLNTLEVARGRAVGQPRVKLTRVETMLAARRDIEV
jgi:ferredoxin--NADP+ reductase